jgi:hypothetical protein
MFPRQSGLSLREVDIFSCMWWMGRGVCNDERAIQRQSSRFVWSIWFISVVRSLSQTNQRNQTDQIPATRRDLECDRKSSEFKFFQDLVEQLGIHFHSFT